MFCLCCMVSSKQQNGSNMLTWNMKEQRQMAINTEMVKQKWQHDNMEVCAHDCLRAFEALSLLFCCSFLSASRWWSWHSPSTICYQHASMFYMLHTVQSDDTMHLVHNVQQWVCLVCVRGVCACPHLSRERAPVSSSAPSDSHQVFPAHLGLPLWSPAMNLLCTLWESERLGEGQKRVFGGKIEQITVVDKYKGIIL